MAISSKPLIKGYELLEPIGEGAYGKVDRDRQPFVDREVAIKVILPEFTKQPDFIFQLTNEERELFGLQIE